jgi:hypothetical protein
MTGKGLTFFVTADDDEMPNNDTHVPLFVSWSKGAELSLRETSVSPPRITRNRKAEQHVLCF